MAADVFISYSSKNKDVADAVCTVLEERGIECWIAPRNILPGREWSEEIMQGIADCRVMVVVFSVDANKSQQVRREVERASHKGAQVLSFRIENVQPTGAMEVHLHTMRGIDALAPPLEIHLERLAHATQKMLSQTNSSLPSPSLAATVPTARQTLVMPAVAPNSPAALGASGANANASNTVTDSGANYREAAPQKTPAAAEENENAQTAKFNWAAFGLNWQWLGAHGVHLFTGAGFLAFVAWVGLLGGLIWSFGLWWVWALLALGFPVWIYAGMRGNALAWRHGTWNSSQEFANTQRFWMMRTVAFWLLLAVVATLFVRSGWNLQVRAGLDNALFQNAVTREIGQKLQGLAPSQNPRR